MDTVFRCYATSPAPLPGAYAWVLDIAAAPPAIAPGMPTLLRLHAAGSQAFGDDLSRLQRSDIAVRQRVLQYTRGTGMGEGRLHRKHSVGIGGHISLGPLAGHLLVHGVTDRRSGQLDAFVYELGATLLQPTP